MRTSHPHPALVAALATAVACAGGAAAAATPSTASLTTALSHSARGSVLNDPSCIPSPDHPEPVVLLHGTSANMWDFNKFARRLRDSGYCPYGINYGKELFTAQAIVPSLYGTADLDSSSEEVATFIDDVLRRTGAEKVDIVAHSQGALHARNYIAQPGNGAKVDRVVTMGASLHGTTLNGFGDILSEFSRALPRLSAFFAGTATIEQLTDSPRMTRARSIPDTAAGVTYTSLYSSADTTITPTSSSEFTAVPGAYVVNIDAETACAPKVSVTHDQMPSNPRMMALALWGLNRDPRATTPSEADCSWD